MREKKSYRSFKNGKKKKEKQHETNLFGDRWRKDVTDTADDEVADVGNIEAARSDSVENEAEESSDWRGREGLVSIGNGSPTSRINDNRAVIDGGGAI